MQLKGSCHCGRIRYEAKANPTEAMSCNCSICRRRGALLFFTTPDNFVLQSSRDEITVYTFKSHTIRHQFCKTCGCAPFAEGTSPDGRAMIAINLRCAEDVDLTKIKVMEFDGASLP